MSAPEVNAHLPIWQRAVTYAAIGATHDDEFLRYPPKGYRAIERKVRLGHGEERWHHAWTETLSLGIQRRSGLRVTRVDAPAEVMENTYTPVTFDDDGQPVHPASTTSGEQVYADTGAQLVRPGDTAVLLLGWGRLSLRIPVRIVYLVDEPTRRGFAYGTLPGHPESGEEAFIVERRDDDSVWLTIRVLSRPGHPALWAVSPLLRLVQAIFLSRYEHALTRPLG
ncbi:DUF1990 family protein [Pseudolysinimonas sp.]|jgi:uncharacterized protein (UPF0548 family)|uniref:DUF1990 family protein n=1 Tax=Pseudolysinimonas sp. TaxID=2680009 RepID=UPI003783E97D